MKQKKMLNKMRSSNKNYNGCLCMKVLTVLTREGGTVGRAGRQGGGVRLSRVGAPSSKKKEEPKAPRSTKSLVPCAILFIYFSCIYFLRFAHTHSHTHIHPGAEQANFIFIFIISLRHINKSHGHDGEKLKMILNN